MTRMSPPRSTGHRSPRREQSQATTSAASASPGTEVAEHVVGCGRCGRGACSSTSSSPVSASGAAGWAAAGDQRRGGGSCGRSRRRPWPAGRSGRTGRRSPPKPPSPARAARRCPGPRRQGRRLAGSAATPRCQANGSSDPRVVPAVPRPASPARPVVADHRRLGVGPMDQEVDCCGDLRRTAVLALRHHRLRPLPRVTFSEQAGSRRGWWQGRRASPVKVGRREPPRVSGRPRGGRTGKLRDGTPGAAAHHARRGQGF